MSAQDCHHLRVSDRDLADLGPRGAAGIVYARTFGLPVLRIRPGRAEPNVHGGVHVATTESHQIRRWFASGPESNLAAKTGRGWLIIDLDRKNGTDGPAELVRFMQFHRVTLPPVPWVSTPNGGRHLWLRVGSEVPSRSSSSRIIPGMGLLADGGHYAILPPSVKLVGHCPQPGDPKQEVKVPVPYMWAPGCCPCQAPMAPGWLLDAMRSMPSLGPADGGIGASTGLAAAPLPPTDNLIRTGLIPGSRSHDMYRLAARLWRQHGQGAAGTVEAACRAVWTATRQGADPFPWSEAVGCIASARRFAARQDKRDHLAAAQFAVYLAGRRMS